MYDGSSSFIDQSNPRGFQISANNEPAWEAWRGTVTYPNFDQAIPHTSQHQTEPMPIKPRVARGWVFRSPVITGTQ